MKKQSTKKMKKTPVRKATDQQDITELMLRDHKPLKKLIKTMKDEDAEFSEIQEAFEEFAPLLEAHAKPEEESLYTEMKESGDDEMRPQGFEGDTEHAIADHLVGEIRGTDDEDAFRARVKVLAEVVEHHIEEEEDEMIPTIRKEMELEERVEIGQNYLRMRGEYEVASEAA